MSRVRRASAVRRPRFAFTKLAVIGSIVTSTSLVAVCCLAALAWAWAFHGGHEVTFESRESRTVDGMPVYNRVRYLDLPGTAGAWLMAQSHEGRAVLDTRPDVLAIVLTEGPGHERNEDNLVPRPTRAEFRQYARAPLGDGLPPDRDEREFSVSCGLCHANGPRAMRPNRESIEAPLGWKDTALLAIWNARIALSGRIEGVASASVARRVPFAPRGARWEEPLPVAACRACHGGNGPFARAPLRMRHFLPIAFLTRSGAMPPLLHPLSVEAQDDVEGWLEQTPAASPLP